MKNTKNWVLAFCSLAFASGAYAQPPQTTPTPPATQSQPVDCSSLTDDEQQFAMQLTDSNKSLFCSKFSAVQRASAMQLTQEPATADATALTPDQAVQKVAVANRLVPSGVRGGCPVK